MADRTDSDSDDEWLRTLIQRPRQADDDADAALFLAELLVAHRTSPMTATYVPLDPSVASALESSSSSVHVVSAVHEVTAVLEIPLDRDRAVAPASSSANRNRRHDVVAIRGVKRRGARQSSLLPPSAIEVYSLQVQHVERLTFIEHDRAMHVSFCRCFFSVARSDLTETALNSLADSLAHRIAELVRGTPPAVFKVGLTRCPRWRFREAPFAYYPEFDRMEVLVAGFVGLITFLEEAVISRVQMIQGCQNVAPGGESPPPPSFPCYLYCVTRQVDDLMADRLRAIRARRLHDVRLSGDKKMCLRP